MKVVVIGTGHVGSAVIGKLLAESFVAEIAAVNRTREKASGEVLDYSHTTAYDYSPGGKLKVGCYSDCEEADLIVVAAGKPAGEGEGRRDLAGTNTEITKQIVEKIKEHTTEVPLIFVPNPVDVNTYTAVKAGYNRDKVIGTGTIVDSARLRSLLAEECSVSPKNVSGYVLGEHGDSAVIMWSKVSIWGYDINTFSQVRGLKKPIDKDKIEKRVKRMGFEIWQKKGFTNHGIAGGVLRIIKTIALDEKAVLPVSVYLDGEYGLNDVALSVPCIIGEAGVEKILEFPLLDEEKERLHNSAKTLKKLIARIRR